MTRGEPSLDRGTILLLDPPREPDLSDLPGVLWDRRVDAWHSLGSSATSIGPAILKGRPQRWFKPLERAAGDRLAVELRGPGHRAQDAIHAEVRLLHLNYSSPGKRS